MIKLFEEFVNISDFCNKFNRSKGFGRIKYLRLFEELNFGLTPINFTKKVDSDRVEYFFNFEGFDWHVIFNHIGKSNKWTRDYDVDSKNYKSSFDYSSGFIQVGKNALKIISIISYITKKFIEEYSPECITIWHMNMKGEKCLISNMNKRSKINFNFLSKNITGYTFNYYSGIGYNKESSNSTFAVICKKGFEEKYLDFFNNSNNHKKIYIE